MVAAAAPFSARRRGLLRASRALAAVGSQWPRRSGPMGRAAGQVARPPPAPLSLRPDGPARPTTSGKAGEGRAGAHRARGARGSAGAGGPGQSRRESPERTEPAILSGRALGPRDFAAGTHASAGSGKLRVFVRSSLAWALIGVECTVVHLSHSVGEAACPASSMHLQNEMKDWHGPTCCVCL